MWSISPSRSRWVRARLGARRQGRQIRDRSRQHAVPRQGRDRSRPCSGVDDASIARQDDASIARHDHASIARHEDASIVRHDDAPIAEVHQVPNARAPVVYDHEAVLVGADPEQDVVAIDQMHDDVLDVGFRLSDRIAERLLGIVDHRLHHLVDTRTTQPQPRSCYHAQRPLISGFMSRYVNSEIDLRRTWLSCRRIAVSKKSGPLG